MTSEPAEIMILGDSFPELFARPVNLHQALDNSKLDSYQQEQLKSEIFPYYKPGEYE